MIAGAEEIYRELPIKFEHKGTYYDGVIDLLVKVNGEWVVIDFKVIPTEDEAKAEKLRQTYNEQLEAYSLGLSKMGIEVSDKRLVAL